MSYTLLLRICSMLYGSCMAPISDGKDYSDFSACALEGTRASNELILFLSPEEINKNQLYIQFTCMKKPDIKL
jgi:hypothetical protein